jgi:hypothetical protein
MNIFRPTYRELGTEEKDQIDGIKDVAQTLWDLIDTLGPSRESSIAKTKLEESIMWVVKGITGPKA